MSSLQGIDDYDIKQKNDWRGWAWNRLVERLDVPVEKARVVYLCGPEDHDRECGIRRGLRNENLIAVDTSAENIERVRRSGGYGIVGTLSDVLRSMRPPLVFHGVLADFCQGIGDGSADLLWDLTASPAQKRYSLDPRFAATAVVVNMQRGRDMVRGAGGRALQAMAGFIGGMAVNEHTFREWFDSPIGGAGDISKHRGWLWYQMYMCHLIEAADASTGGGHWRTVGVGRSTSREIVHASSAGFGPIEKISALTRACAAYVDSKFFSYRASRVWMDSVAMRFSVPFIADVLDANYRKAISDVATTRKLAAMKAVQTQRGAA